MDKVEHSDKLLNNKRKRNITKTEKKTKEKAKKEVNNKNKANLINKIPNEPIDKKEKSLKNKVDLEQDKNLVKTSRRTRGKSYNQSDIRENLLESIGNFDNETNKKEPASKSKKRIKNEKREKKEKLKQKSTKDTLLNEKTIENKKKKTSKKKTQESENKEEIFNPILQNFTKEDNPKQNFNGESENLISNFIMENQTDKPDKEKTLLDFINDSKSGIPMKVAEIEKINNIQASAFSKEKSKKSSMTLSCSNLSEMMVNNLERETYKFLKPKVIIEADGSMRIEKPNYSEIAQKIQDENFKKNFPYIVHNNEKHKITSSSFRKSSHSDKWSDQETQLFYEALTLFGCNFSYLEIILKPRSRDQIKKKFTREEKYNKEKIEEALLRNRTSDSAGLKSKDNEKHKLFKFVSILKNFKEEKKKEEKNKAKKSKYSKYNQDSDITLSNYDNADIYDFYNNDKRTSSRINSNLNLKENENISKTKDKNDKENNVIKNVDNLYSKILFDEEVNGKHSMSQENFKKLMSELEEKSQSENESDEDSIEREKEKYKNYTANTRSSNKIQENNIRNNIVEDKDVLNNKGISSSTHNRKEALTKKVEEIIENNKEMKAIIEANKNVDSTQQVFDFLANFK